MSRIRVRAALLVPIVVLIGAGVAGRLSIPTASPPTPLMSHSLQAITCPSPGRCISVGLAGSAETVFVPLTAALQHGAWTIRSRPVTLRLGDAYPAAVACPSSSSCLAVGQQEIPASYLGAPSAGDRPLTQLWDGRTWRQGLAAAPPHTQDAELRGVACSESVCMAVGEYAKRGQADDRALAETWDGDRWRLQLPTVIRSSDSRPDEATLSDVACVSSRSCTAVGQFTVELEGLGSVGGLASSMEPLVEQWDGARWRVVHAVNPNSPQAELNAVSCTPLGRCIAVGLRTVRGAARTLAEMSSGGHWQLLRTSDPLAFASADLKDVSCPASNRCIAVGDAVSAGQEKPLIESWDGRRWTIEPATTPAAFSASTLNSIDCAAVARCQAVGSYEARTPALHSFSATLVDGHWMLRPVPGT